MEDPVPAANRRPGTRTRERESEARHEIHRVADMRLQLLAHADAERQAPIQPEVVLPVDAELVLRKRRLKLAEPLRECVRRAGQERLEAAERERSRGVARIEVAITRRLRAAVPARIACLPTLKSKLSATSSVRVDPFTRHAGAAAAERVDDDHRGRARYRSRRGLSVVPLHPELVERGTAQDRFAATCAPDARSTIARTRAPSD